MSVFYVNDLTILQERFPDRMYSVTWSDEYNAYEIDMEDIEYATKN